MPDKAPASPARQSRRLRLFNRRMFFFFGPPQLGNEHEPPATFDRDPLCPRCGRRESEHTVFRDAAKSFAQCPE